MIIINVVSNKYNKIFRKMIIFVFFIVCFVIIYLGILFFYFILYLVGIFNCYFGNILFLVFFL